MRSFLRYAQFRGEVTPELVAAVPSGATWTTKPDSPKAIAPEHAQRAIDSCDLGTAPGLRARAVLLLPARLGLRAREIIALQLDDCDWDRGRLRVHGKFGRVGVPPMPIDVGQAIRTRRCRSGRHAPVPCCAREESGRRRGRGARWR
jgi:integrase